MAKIYTYDLNEDLLLNLLNKKLENNDLIGALTVTKTLMERTNYNKLDLISKRADIFYRMKNYSRACEEWFKYLTLTDEVRQTARAYNGLGACFYKLQENAVAGYYFNKQMLADKKSYFNYSSVTLEYFEEILSAKNNYYLAYPLDKADFTKLILLAEEKLKVGNYSGAIEDLKIIPSTSSFYPLSLITSSIAKFFLGDIDGAIVDIENSIKIESSTVAICNAISIFLSVNDKEKADFYFNMLDLATAKGVDLYKILLVYCEKGEDQTALSLAKRYLKENPFDVTVLFLLGLINFNLKNYEDSENAFKKCYLINGGYVEKYYLTMASNRCIMNNKMQYQFDLPENVRRIIVEEMKTFLSLKREERMGFEGKILSICEYVFNSSSYSMQSTMITLLGETKFKKSFEIMKNALLSLNVYDGVKVGIIGYLTAEGYDGKVPVVFNKIYKNVTLYKSEILNNQKFIEAYAFLICKMVVIEDNLKPLKISVENIYKKLTKNGNIDKITSVKALSAVIYEYSTIQKIESRRDFAKFFETDCRRISEIKALLKD